MAREPCDIFEPQEEAILYSKILITIVIIVVLLWAFKEQQHAHRNNAFHK